MKNKWRNGKHRIIVVLIIVTLIMIGVGLLMRFRLKSLLQVYTEKQVTEQARTLASLSLEQFDLEIRNLENIAKSVKVDMKQTEAFFDICIGVFVSAVFTSLLEPAYRATVPDIWFRLLSQDYFLHHTALVYYLLSILALLF